MYSNTSFHSEDILHVAHTLSFFTPSASLDRKGEALLPILQIYVPLPSTLSIILLSIPSRVLVDTRTEVPVILYQEFRYGRDMH